MFITLYYVRPVFKAEDAVSKQINDYKVKLQKADQEVATLQATVIIINHILVYGNNSKLFKCAFILFIIRWPGWRRK